MICELKNYAKKNLCIVCACVLKRYSINSVIFARAN